MILTNPLSSFSKTDWTDNCCYSNNRTNRIYSKKILKLKRKKKAKSLPCYSLFQMAVGFLLLISCT